MAFIEPCEVEELLGSCCNCEETSQGDDDGSDDGGGGGGGSGIDPECGVPWGGVCTSTEDCAGNFCCRDINHETKAMTSCGYGGGECLRCWDCGGISIEGCDPCGSGEFDCDTCHVDHQYCPGGCMHGYGCDAHTCGAEDWPPNGWHSPQTHGGCDPFYCGGHQHYPGPCECLPYDKTYLDIDCDSPWLSELGIPEYMECASWLNRFRDMTPGACCVFIWDSVENEWVYDVCEIRPMALCGDHNVYWGINTSCEEFQDCCGVDAPDCEVDLDCEEGDCCSDFGNCVTCASCDCQCLDSITAWECCEETDGDGIWHSGETCGSYECGEDCPEEPECGPGSPCPPCYSCNSGVCEPECQESSDCSSGRCCSFGCCIECVDECSNDGNCDGDKCCVNGSCTYDCPSECDEQNPCPGEQECEDGICADPPEPDCEDDSGCPHAQCCEDGECVFCDPDPPDDDECSADGDCPDGLCCFGFPSGNVCFSCPDPGECGCELDGPIQRCDWVPGIPTPCEDGDTPDDYGMCYSMYCCCNNSACPFMECYDA